MIEIHLVFNVLLSPPLRGGDEGEGEKEPFYHPHPMHHVGCMTVLNLTWFRANPPPCLRRGFGRQASKGGGDNLLL